MFGKALKLFLLLLAGYLLLGTVAWVMPDWREAKHVQESLDHGDFSEDYPKAILIGSPWLQDQYTMDNFTDALILNQCIHLRSEGWRSALTIPRYEEGVVQYVNLRNAMVGDTAAGRIIHYPRYWHGSTFITRVLLTFTTFGGIRYFFFFVTTLLMAWCGIRLWRHVSKAACVCMLLALLSVNVYVKEVSSLLSSTTS